MAKERWYYALVAFPLVDAQDIQTRINQYESNPETVSERTREIIFMINQAAKNRWRITYQSTQYIVVWSAFKAFIKTMLENQYPNHIVVGAWKTNGLQVGERYNNSGAIVGTPTFPFAPGTFNLFPQVPVYDSNGQQIGTRPFTGDDMYLFCGQTKPVVW